MRLYWLCGIALAAAGLVSFVTRIPAAHVALIGGALEVLFSVALFLWKDAKVNRC
jgi:hypothetical protein